MTYVPNKWITYVLTATLSSTVPSKKADQASATDKEKEPVKLPPMPKDSSKEKEASQSQKLVLVTLPFTTKEDPKSKSYSLSSNARSAYQDCSKDHTSPKTK